MALGWMADRADRLSAALVASADPDASLPCPPAGDKSPDRRTILIRHLGALALVSMKQLQSSADPAVRQRAAGVLEIFEAIR
jgi:hypothetical protein